MMMLLARLLFAAPMTVDDCVAAALAESARVAEADAKVAEYRARLAEVESAFYPKLMGLAFVAPMFTVELGDIASKKASREWKSPGDWGPYARLEAVLAQPIYSFGRIARGETAASERLALERARLRETRQIVALEVHRMYFVVLYARSIQPTLKNAADIVAKAEQQGRQMYDEATGDVTQADLMKLRWAATEVEKHQTRARLGAELSLAALKHAMGWPAGRALELAMARLELPAFESQELAKLLEEASGKRPEWAQLAHGKAATVAWEDFERMANLPLAFVAGQFKAAWTPTREDSDNPYHNDPYNELFGGVAIGLQLDLDPWRASARGDAARAVGEQVSALERFAATGIPMQVIKAHTELEQARRVAELSAEGAQATRKWMTFAAAAFATGTGEARDLLEGLAAYVQARNSEYEGLRDLHIARAELEWAVGRIAP